MALDPLLDNVANKGSSNYVAPVKPVSPIKPITPQAMSGSATPAVVVPPPPATQAAGLQGLISAQTDAFTQGLAANTQSTQAGATDSLTSLLAALNKKGGTAQYTADAYKENGVNDAQTGLNDINNKILAEQRALKNQEDSLKKNSAGFVGSGLQDELTRVNNESVSKQADLAVIQMATQGKYSAAKEIADRAVAAKTEADTNRLQTLQFLYNENKDLFTTAQQREFEAKQADRNRLLDTQKQTYLAEYEQKSRQADPLYQANLQGQYLSNAKAKAELSPVGIGSGNYAGVINTILGSGKFTAQQAAAIRNGINNGEDPLTVVKNNAKNIMGQTEATSVTKYESAADAMNNLQSALAEYYANGGKTGIFSGNYEKVINNLGNVNDPKLVDLAVQIQSQLQVYRNAVSGTAYSEQEGKDIASIFPGINKSEGLNQAVISGRLKAFDDSINGVYASTLGPSTYNGLRSATGGKGTQSSKDFIESALTKAGHSYDAILSQVPPGRIAAIDNNTGTVVAILPGEFNSTRYTKL